MSTWINSLLTKLRFVQSFAQNHSEYVEYINWRWLGGFLSDRFATSEFAGHPTKNLVFLMDMKTLFYWPDFCVFICNLLALVEICFQQLERFSQIPIRILMAPKNYRALINLSREVIELKHFPNFWWLQADRLRQCLFRGLIFGRYRASQIAWKLFDCRTFKMEPAENWKIFEQKCSIRYICIDVIYIKIGTAGRAKWPIFGNSVFCKQARMCRMVRRWQLHVFPPHTRSETGGSC